MHTTHSADRVPASTCVRKETVDMDILITFRNDDRKIMQSIKIMCGSPTRIIKGPIFYEAVLPIETM